MPRIKKIGVLWLKTSQDGKTKFFSGIINGGILGDIQIAIFRNTFKKEEKDPDYNIVLSEPKPVHGESKADYDDDNIPF